MNPSAIDVFRRLMILKAMVVHTACSCPLKLVEEFMKRNNEKEKNEINNLLIKHSKEIIDKLIANDLWEHASLKEQVFFQSYGMEMTEQARINASWRIESIAMLMWALNMLPEWPKIDEQINIDLIKIIPVLKNISSDITLNIRPSVEINDKRDLIEFWHWRVRTKQLIDDGKVFQADENHKTIGLNSFDDIVRYSAKYGYEQGDLPEIMDEDFVFLGKPFRKLSKNEFSQAQSIVMERHFALNWLCGYAPDNRWDETPTDT